MGPDLDPNCLTVLIVFLKEFFEKVNLSQQTCIIEFIKRFEEKVIKCKALESILSLFGSKFIKFHITGA